MRKPIRFQYKLRSRRAQAYTTVDLLLGTIHHVRIVLKETIDQVTHNICGYCTVEIPTV